MIKKLFSYFLSVKKQLAKFLIVGLSSLALDIISLVFLKEVLGLTPVQAVITNQILVISFVFFMNKYWSFGQPLKTMQQIWRFLLVAGFNYLFSVVAMYLFNSLLGLDYLLIRVATIASMSVWNFFLYKYWVYAVESKR